MKLCLALLIALACLPSWGAAISLHYEGSKEHRCPDEVALRQLVAARLGVDPFTADAASLVTVKVESGTPLQAQVVLESPGSRPRRKVLAGGDCTELIQSVAMAVALAVDPLIKRPEATPTAPLSPVEPVAEPAAEPAPEAGPPNQGPPIQWGLGIGASANLGLAVGAQPTLRLEGRARATLWSLGVEARFAWPVIGALSQGALTTSAVLGALVPCLHWRWLAGCADVTAGALRLEGRDLASTRQATVFHASVGLRLLFTVPLSERFGLGVMAEGQVPLTRASAVVGSERVWSVPPTGGGLGLWASFLL